MRNLIVILISMLWALPVFAEQGALSSILNLKSDISKLERFVPESESDLTKPAGRRLCFVLGKVDARIQEFVKAAKRPGFFKEEYMSEAIAQTTDIETRFSNTASICGFSMDLQDPVVSYSDLKLRLRTVSALLSALELLAR